MGASAFETPPDPQSIAKAHELGRSSSVSMAFLDASLTAKVEKLRLQPDYGVILQAIRDTRESLMIRDELLDRVSEECWRGTAREAQVALYKPSGFNYVDGSALEGIKQLNMRLGKDNELSEIILVYDVDENGQFNRGYVVNQQIVDDKKEEHKNLLNVLDKIFHSWLVTNNMAADDTGAVFHKTKQGELTQKVKREDILELIEDPEKGLRSTINKLDPNIKLQLVWAPPEVQASAKQQQLEQPEAGGGIQPNQ